MWFIFFWFNYCVILSIMVLHGLGLNTQIHTNIQINQLGFSQLNIVKTYYIQYVNPVNVFLIQFWLWGRKHFLQYICFLNLEIFLNAHFSHLTRKIETPINGRWLQLHMGVNPPNLAYCHSYCHPCFRCQFCSFQSSLDLSSQFDLKLRTISLTQQLFPQTFASKNKQTKIYSLC